MGVRPDLLPVISQGKARKEASLSPVEGESTSRRGFSFGVTMLVTSLPEFMNGKLFGKTVLVVKIRFGLFVGPSTQPGRCWFSAWACGFVYPSSNATDVLFLEGFFITQVDHLAANWWFGAIWLHRVLAGLYAFRKATSCWAFVGQSTRSVSCNRLLKPTHAQGRWSFDLSDN